MAVLRRSLGATPARAPARRASLPGLLLAGLALGGLVATCGPGAPEAPTPGNLAHLDPVLRASIEAAVRAVRADGGPDAWHALAELYHANAFHPEAEVAYAVVVERAPDDATAWYERAVNAINDGRPADALRHGERATELDPTYAPALWRMGEWCFADGDLDGASAWYQRAIQADPAHPGGWIGSARVQLQRERFLDAVQTLEARVIGGPSDGYGRQLLARAYQGLGNDEAARTLAAQGRNALPNVPDPRLGTIFGLRTGRMADIERAITLTKNGRAADAVRMLEPLVAQEPDDVTALSNYAFALLQAGRPEEALARAREAIAIEPASHASLLIEALALVRIGGARARPQAIEILRGALDTTPSAASIYNWLAMYLRQEGDREGALQVFRDGLVYAPEDVLLVRNAATLERDLGLLADAERSFARWAELAPGEPTARIGLADVRLRRGDHAGAEAALGPLVDALDQARGPLDPLVIDARKLLIEALEGQGKLDAAAVHRERLP
jgi:predicted Zn-dependent protease